MTVNLSDITHHPIFKFFHGGFDGVYLGKSMVDYGEDAFNPTSNLAHDPLQVNANTQHFYADHNDLSIIISEAIVITLLAVLGNVGVTNGDKAKESKAAQLSFYLVCFWPYFRQLLSGLKNGRHAVINTSFIAQQLSHASNFFHLANPIGIGVGIVLAANLIWYHRMNENRRKHIKANRELLAKIKTDNLSELTFNELIHRQHKATRAIAFASAALDGMTDGAYLYGCLFTLIGYGICSFSPPVLIAAITVISFYVAISVITRLHEEYENQQELEKSAVGCELALLENKVAKLESQLASIKQQIQEIDNRTANPLPNDAETHERLISEKQLIEEQHSQSKLKIDSLQREIEKDYGLDKLQAELDLRLKENEIAKLYKEFNTCEQQINEIHQRSTNPQENDEQRLQQLNTQKNTAKINLEQAIDALKSMRTEFDKKYSNAAIKSTKGTDILWRILRNILSGLKNAKAAVDFFTYFVAKSLITFIVGICSAALYGLYLGTRTIADTLSSKKIPEKPQEAPINLGQNRHILLANPNRPLAPAPSRARDLRKDATRIWIS